MKVAWEIPLFDPLCNRNLKMLRVFPEVISLVIGKLGLKPLGSWNLLVSPFSLKKGPLK